MQLYFVIHLNVCGKHQKLHDEHLNLPQTLTHLQSIQKSLEWFYHQRLNLQTSCQLTYACCKLSKQNLKLGLTHLVHPQLLDQVYVLSLLMS